MQKRLDLILYEKGFFKTKEKAKEAVLSGIVFSGDKNLTKPGAKFEEDVNLTIKGEKLKYVSRAGLKLEKAKEFFNLNFNEKVVLDAGASTGGFTDFCLQNGAKLVYSVDVGHNQLDNSLKHNPKVKNIEGTDIRKIEKQNFLPLDFIVSDLSFISLTKVLDKFYELLPTKGSLVCLIKPQFECGKEIAQKTKGIIKDEKLQQNICKNIVNFAKNIGFCFIGLTDSPILGTAGNKEFLAYFKKLPSADKKSL